MTSGRHLPAARFVAVLLVLAVQGTAYAQATPPLETVGAAVASPEVGDRVLHGFGYGLLGSLAGGLVGGGMGCGIGAVTQLDTVGYFSGPLFGCVVGGIIGGAPSFLLGMPLGISLAGMADPALHPAHAYWGTFLGAGAGIGLGALVFVISEFQSAAMWAIPPLALVGAVLGWSLPAREPVGAGVAGAGWTPTLALSADGRSGTIGFAGRF